jgi:hypothetical protein
VILAAALSLAILSPLVVQDPGQAVQSPLQAAARALAKAGRRAEVAEVLGLLAAVKLPQDSLDKLKAACDADLVKPAKAPQPSISEAARQLKTAARSLEKSLAEADPVKRKTLAAALVAIDGESAEARKILGYERVNGQWLRPEERAARARRGAIVEALRNARRLDVEVEVSESKDPVLLAVFPQGGVCVKAKGFTLHTFWSAEKASRVVRETFRSLALSNFLRSGSLVVPSSVNSTWIHVDTPDRHQRAIDTARQVKYFDDFDLKYAKTVPLTSYFDSRGRIGIVNDLVESHAEAYFVTVLSGLMHKQACLAAGHLNYVCLSYLGTPIPRFSWYEDPSAAAATAVDDPSSAERQALLRLSKAGIAGCRAWMTYLAARHEDPPWSRSMVDELGKVAGQDLLKSTSVVEYLQELGTINRYIRDSDPDAIANRGKDASAVMTRVLNASFPEFEDRWRDWILSPKRGLLERLDDREEKAPLPKDALELLTELNAVRRVAIRSLPDGREPSVSVDRDLSAGARLHSLYLAKNPHQAAAWPDAHEEYPDKEGFTTEGALAGTRGVIAPGSSSAKDAVDAWMGTFYHRLPLLDPGLQRVGWSMDMGFAVLDVASMVAPTEVPTSVVWPHDGQRDVPTRFRPELPNPVPDADQSEWGYPVTLQVFAPEAVKYGLDVQVRLHEGDVKGAEVDCHFSSPSKPTNPILAPENAFCLIPKAPLKPSTLYTAVATWPAGGKTLRWSFRTK